MDEKQTDPFVCSRCADTYSTCCRLTPGDEVYCFPVSPEEAARIEEETKELVSRKELHIEITLVEENNSPEFKENLYRLLPQSKDEIDTKFPEGATHLRLAVTGGKCPLLGDNGCLLTRESRPYYCRLFPFWIMGGELTYFDARQCLACEENRG
ncbi:MAG: zinc/iron-chelating domain-containing protein [Desulfovibrio sp.]